MGFYLCHVSDKDGLTVKGIHFYRSNEQPHPNVKQWNVTEMKVSSVFALDCCIRLANRFVPQLDPTKRHSDKSLVAEFWRQLELWIARWVAQLGKLVLLNLT